MRPTITVKGEVEESRTCKQTVKFLVSVPEWDFLKAGKYCHSRSMDPIAEKDIDIQDGWGEKMCRLELVVSGVYLSRLRQAGDHGVKVVISTEERVEINATVSAVLLLSDGTPSDRKDKKYYVGLGFSRHRAEDNALKIILGERNEWETYAQRRTGYDDTRNPEHDDHLVIQFTMTMEYCYGPLPKETAVMNGFLKQAARERNDALNRIFSSPLFEKVKLICSDGEEISVSKDLLATCCPVFEPMFRSNMQEAETKVIRVDDVKGSVMRILLDYWFEAKLAESWSQPDVIGDLALAADKYGVTPMMKFLDDAMGNGSIVTSSLQLLEIAAKAGYKNAEKMIIKNLVGRTNYASTMDDFYAALGVDTALLKEKSQLDNQELRRLITDIDKGWSSENSTYENLHRVADLGLVKQEKIILSHLKDRLRSIEDRQELLEVVGLSEFMSSDEPAKKKTRSENTNGYV